MARQTIFDNALRPVAENLINQFGKDILLVSRSRVPDPATGGVTSVTTTQLARGVISDYGDEYADDSSSVEPTDVQIWIAAKSKKFKLSAGDSIHLGKKTSDPQYNVSVVVSVYTGESEGIYRVFCGI